MLKMKQGSGLRQGRIRGTAKTMQSNWNEIDHRAEQETRRDEREREKIAIN